MSHKPRDPTKPHSTSDSLEEHVDAPLHEEVFGSSDGPVNDTPRGAIGANVNLGYPAVQLEPNKPLRHIGDTDQADYQPGGGRR